jgi:hypothetical protein
MCVNPVRSRSFGALLSQGRVLDLKFSQSEPGSHGIVWDTKTHSIQSFFQKCYFHRYTKVYLPDHRCRIPLGKAYHWWCHFLYCKIAVQYQNLDYQQAAVNKSQRDLMVNLHLWFRRIQNKNSKHSGGSELSLAEHTDSKSVKNGILQWKSTRTWPHSAVALQFERQVEVPHSSGE